MRTNIQPHPLLTSMNQKIDALTQLVSDIKSATKDKFTFSEAAKYLCIAESTLYKLTSKGEIGYNKPNGKLIKFKRSDLDEWDNRRRIPSKHEIERETNNIESPSKNHAI